MNPKFDDLTQDIINQHTSIYSLVTTLGFNVNTRTSAKVIPYLESKGFNCHSLTTHTKKRKYEQAEKKCLACENTFVTSIGHPREKRTCSVGCANTYFRSGENANNRKDPLRTDDANAYRRLCFIFHGKKCVVCSESTIVAAHHYDGNHDNNDIGNLVPLCPTHHVYIHSKHAHLIKDQVDKYVKNFNSKQKISGGSSRVRT